MPQVTTQRKAWSGRSHPDQRLHLMYAVGGAAIAAFIPFMALLMRSRGFRPDRIGLILAAASLGGVVANPLWSHLADTRLGTTRTLVLTSIASIVAAVALMFTGSRFWVTLPVAVAFGAATGPGSGLADTLTLAHLGPARAFEYGTIRLWTSAGWAVAVIAFGALFEWGSLSLLLPVYAATMIAFAAIVLRFPSTVPTPPADRSRLGSVGRLFRARPRFALLLGGLFLVATATSAAWGFLPIRIASKGGGPFLVGLGAGLAAVVEIPIMRRTQRLLRRVSLRTMYVTGIAVYVGLMLTWTILANPVSVALSTTVRGIGFAFTYVGLVLIAGQLVPPSLQNTGQVLVQTTTIGLALVAGNSIGGLVYQHLGPTALFGGSATLAAVGAIAIWMILSEPEVARPIPPPVEPGED
jgi:MFS transporter, PPP family, 3-phenylpropionic acid transporter